LLCDCLLRCRTVAAVVSEERQNVAAGYVLYGASTELVYSVGDGVQLFALDIHARTPLYFGSPRSMAELERAIDLPPRQ
jgi:fructose-1,6-bisphosphatase